MSTEENETSARALAVAYIGFSLKTSGKVNMYLKAKGYDVSVREYVVSSLIADGYINDLKCCIQLAKTRSGKRAESVRRFHDRLLHSGVAQDVASDFIRDYPDDVQTINDLINSRYNSEDFELSEEGARLAMRSRVTRFLQSRGYNSGLIEEALSRRFNRVE